MYDGSAGPDRQTLGSLIDQLRSGRGLILKIAGPIILLGLMYAAVAPSVYTAMGSVQVASWAKGATSAGAQSQLDVVLDQSPVLTAAEIGVNIIAFPELALTGYECESEKGCGKK